MLVRIHLWYFLRKKKTTLKMGFFFKDNPLNKFQTKTYIMEDKTATNQNENCIIEVAICRIYMEKY